MSNLLLQYCYWNHYETLKLDRQATQKEIKRSYYKLAKLWHPDANLALSQKKSQSQSVQNSHSEFVKINTAYEVLSDEKKRTEYDNSLNTSTTSETFHG